jgi:hypothetical protein
LALKAGVWFRRVRFVISSPDPRHLRRFQVDSPLNALSGFVRPALIAGLASHYTSAELGNLRFEPAGGQLRVYTNAWNTLVTTRKNDDGTVSLVSIDPGWVGSNELVVGTAAGKRTLTVRDGQHVYVFTESS